MTVPTTSAPGGPVVSNTIVDGSSDSNGFTLDRKFCFKSFKANDLRQNHISSATNGHSPSMDIYRDPTLPPFTPSDLKEQQW